MRTRIDADGRVVIPKPLRDRLGLEPGGFLEVRERDGRIELEAAATPMGLRRTRRGGVAAVTGVAVPPLTDEIVRATLERVRP